MGPGTTWDMLPAIYVRRIGPSAFGQRSLKRSSQSSPTTNERPVWAEISPPNNVGLVSLLCRPRSLDQFDADSIGHSSRREPLIDTSIHAQNLNWSLLGSRRLAKFVAMGVGRPQIRRRGDIA